MDDATARQGGAGAPSRAAACRSCAAMPLEKRRAGALEAVSRKMRLRRASDEMLADEMETPNIDVVLLDVKEGLSRLHASRRLFALLRREASELSVVHHLRVPQGTKKDGAGAPAGRPCAPALY